MWQDYPGFIDILKDDWDKPCYGTPMFRVYQKMKRLKKTLKEINRKGFNNIQNVEHTARKKLEECQNDLKLDPLNNSLIENEKQARNCAMAAQVAYFKFLSQKAHHSWIKDGDANTSMFHASIRQRNNSNLITSISGRNGEWLNKPVEVIREFTSFYENLLGTQMANRKKVITSVIEQGKKVTQDQQDFLMRPYTEDEVKEAVFSIPGKKAPGPDGYSSYFMQDNWEILGSEVSSAVISFLNSGMILKEINTTTLTMVPKNKCPNTVSDFRPIACCNVLYKIASKVICKRLREVMPSIIAQNQGGFVKGRFIAHNVMICQDLVKHYSRKNSKANCLIKLDIKKAYDTVEWDFLEEMLEGLNFPRGFSDLVMNCVKTPKFSLMINGSLHGYFSAKRGLRQGDPISPLLFVLGMEYLSRIMMEIGTLKDFNYHENCHNLNLNHLCFADDVLLFCQGDYVSIYRMLQGLELFTRTSGLHPSKEKTDVYCSGMKDSEMRRVSEASSFKCSNMPFTYLGIPIKSKKLSTQDCHLLVERITGRIRGWSSRNLSFAGRAILVNSVLLTIHTYWSQIMILPKKILKEIETVCRSYLWTGKTYSDVAGNVAWNMLCKPKQMGGLGFKNCYTWNLAAIGKHVWNVAGKKDNLWVKWVHQVYLGDKDWWDYSKPTNGSWYWRKIVEVKETLKNKINRQGFPNEKYSIKQNYKMLDDKDGKKFWYKVVWNHKNIPKHSFIGWLAMNDRLKTRSRLRKMNIIPSSECELCGEAEETSQHLFFACRYSKQCWEEIKACLSWNIRANDLMVITRWISIDKVKNIKKHIFATALMALVYHVWRVRNDACWNQKIWKQEVVVKRIKEDVKNRIGSIDSSNSQDSIKNWFRNL